MTPSAPTDLPAGARVGLILGATSWALALAVACLVTGEFGLLWRVALPGLAVSLLLAMVAVAALRRRRPSGRSNAAQFELLAALCLLAAVLLTLAGAWVLPALLASRPLREVLDATRSATSLPWPIPAACGAAGLVFLCLARRRATSP